MFLCNIFFPYIIDLIQLESWQPVMSLYSTLLAGAVVGSESLASAASPDWIQDCSAITQTVARLYPSMIQAAVPHNLAVLFANLAVQASQAKLHERAELSQVKEHLIEL